jgi:branched-chain amino acid transport system substrate-binding protein
LISGCSHSGPTETLWLGHVAPMSGPEKIEGDHARQGIRIAVGEVNQDPVLGKKIAVRHADARSAEAEAVRLASANRVVALLGGTDSIQAEQLARGAESAGVPILLQAALPSGSPGENVFSCAVSLARRGQVLGKFAAQEKKAGKVALFVDERLSAASPVAEAFRRELPADGTQRLDYKNAEDFARLVQQAAGAKSAALLYIGSVRDWPRFHAEVRKALPAAMVFYGGEESHLPELLADPATGEGVYLATCYVASADTAANQEFVAAYREQYHEPPDVNAALAYDGARLICQVLRKAGTSNSARLREALPQVQEFSSLTGALAFGKDHHAQRPVFVVRIKKGEIAVEKRYTPAD